MQILKPKLLDKQPGSATMENDFLANIFNYAENKLDWVGRSSKES